MNTLSPRDEKILELLRQPGRPKSELMDEMRRALSENRIEFAHSIMETLDERFPGWDQTASHSQTSGAVTAMFCGNSREFDTPTAAYVWLVENMIDSLPNQLDLLYDEVVFSTTVAQGERGAIYLAKSPQDLFPGSPHRASDPSKRKKMKNGWYLSLNLNTKEKNDRLYAFAGYCGLKQNRDWRWSADASPDLDKLLSSLGI